MVQPARFHFQDGARRAARHVDPDGVARKARAPSAAGPGRAPRRPPAKWPPCPETGSRRRARRRRGTARRRHLQRHLPVGKARAGRLHLAGILAVLRLQRDAAGHQDARQIARARQRHHHRRQALVAGGHADHAAARGQGADQPAEHRWRRRCGRPGSRTCRRALRAAVAGIGAVAGEGDGAERLSIPWPRRPSAGRLPSGRCGSRARSACRRPRGCRRAC